MSTMTSRERVIATIEGRIPDRVPLGELTIDPKVIDSICPGMSYEDFIEHVDMDVVTCLTMAVYPEEVKWVDREKGIWRDKWGALQVKTQDVISISIPPAPIESEDDLAAYVSPDPARSPVVERVKALVKRFKYDKAIVVVGEACLAPSEYLRAGLQNLMIDYATRPDFVCKLAQIGVDYHVELYRRLIAEGADVVLIGDDYAYKSGPFMSPAHFAEYVVPGLTTVVRAIKDAGAYCIHHTDGNIWKILDMIISSGVDMLGPLEPAYMRLDEVRRHTSFKVGVLGNVDVDLLSRGTVDEVRQATKELLARVSPLGGHMASSGNTISSSVKGENFIAMLETVKEYGHYPIDISM